MSRQRDLDKLLSDLRSFLLLLDRESLSAAARAKKKSVWELLGRLQGPAEDAEYMIMRCLSPSLGPQQGQASPGSRSSDAAGGRAQPGPHGENKEPGAPPRPLNPPAPPTDDSYEDTEPPGHGSTGGGDSDSSHYESYGEEEEEEEEEGVKDRAHYLRSSTEAGRPEPQLCGFLWRKRWLGQWAKQLFIVREHVLLCFRCAADLQPVLELDLRGCRVSAKEQRGKKMPHALKVTGTAGEVLVIGFQSRQQAEDWRKVIEEVSSDAPSGLAALSVPASPSSRLSRLGKEEEEDENRCRQSPARSPRHGEDAKGGFLAVRLRGRWQRLWCAVRHGALRMFPEPGDAQRPVCALRLDGCEVTPGAAAGSPQNLRIRIAQRGRELALLQARSDEEREAWLKTLQARGGAEPKKGDGPPPRPPRPSSRPAAGGLLLRRVPTPNAYMDDPSGQGPAETPKQFYSNAERLQQLVTPARAAEPGPGSTGAAPESRVCCAQLCQQQRPGWCPARAGSSPCQACQCPAAPGQPQCAEPGSVPVPAHPDPAPEEGDTGRARCPRRAQSLSQAGAAGAGAAGAGRAGQAESRLRDEPAEPREVPQGSHRCHRQLGWLRGIIPQAAAEAHHVSQERPEAATIPGRGGEGKCDEEDKGMGDEICDVSTTESPRELRAARGSCRTSLGSAWNLNFTHHINATTTHIYFYIQIYRCTHISSPPGALLPLPAASPPPFWGAQLQKLLALSIPRISRDGCG